tara:strand:+ start:1163 stop:1711 length:549 start_codon:yes stop_codon:yes gene_type:complete
MRIVISGTHASGKSTLIADFASRRPEFEVFPDPYELLDDAPAEPDAGVMFAQLQLSAARLLDLPPGANVVAERGPLDFLAYLEALDALGRPTRSSELFRRGVAATIEAMQHVDLLVLLPLTASDRIEVSEEEDLELRTAMNEALLELADDTDLVGAARVVEVTGSPAGRLAQLMQLAEQHLA